MIEIEYAISVMNIKKINMSLNQLIPSDEVKGKYLNYNYVIYPKEGRITISDDHNQDILKCTKSIARNFGRKQNIIKSSYFIETVYFQAVNLLKRQKETELWAQEKKLLKNSQRFKPR